MNELNQTEPAHSSHTEYILSIVYVLEVRTALPLGGLAGERRENSGGEAGSSKLLSAGRQRSTRPVKQAKRNHFAQNYLFDFSLFAFVVNQLRLNE